MGAVIAPRSAACHETVLVPSAFQANSQKTTLVKPPTVNKNKNGMEYCKEWNLGECQRDKCPPNSTDPEVSQWDWSSMLGGPPSADIHGRCRRKHIKGMGFPFSTSGGSVPFTRGPVWKVSDATHADGCPMHGKSCWMRWLSQGIGTTTSTSMAASTTSTSIGLS